MKRRSFIKALPILAGAAVVIPKVLFAKAPEGLTMAKWIRADHGLRLNESSLKLEYHTFGKTSMSLTG